MTNLPFSFSREDECLAQYDAGSDMVVLIRRDGFTQPFIVASMMGGEFNQKSFIGQGTAEIEYNRRVNLCRAKLKL